MQIAVVRVLRTQPIGSYAYDGAPRRGPTADIEEFMRRALGLRGGQATICRSVRLEMTRRKGAHRLQPPGPRSIKTRQRFPKSV